MDLKVKVTSGNPKGFKTISEDEMLEKCEAAARKKNKAPKRAKK